MAVTMKLRKGLSNMLLTMALRVDCRNVHREIQEMGYTYDDDVLEVASSSRFRL